MTERYFKIKNFDEALNKQYSTLKIFCSEFFKQKDRKKIADLLPPSSNQRSKALNSFNPMISNNYDENACYIFLECFQNDLVNLEKFIEIVVTEPNLKNNLFNYYGIKQNRVVEVIAPSFNKQGVEQEQKKDLYSYFEPLLTPFGHSLKKEIIVAHIENFLKSFDLTADPIFKILMTSLASLERDQTIWNLINENSKFLCFVDLVILFCAYKKMVSPGNWMEFPKYDPEYLEKQSRTVFQKITNELELVDLLRCTEEQLKNWFSQAPVDQLMNVFTTNENYYQIQNLFGMGNPAVYLQKKEEMNSNPELKKKLFLFFKERNPKAINLYAMEENLVSKLRERTAPIEFYNYIPVEKEDPFKAFLKKCELDDEEIINCLNIFTKEKVKLTDLKEYDAADLKAMEIPFGLAKRIVKNLDKI